MQNTVKNRIARALQIGITFLPWLVASYSFWWLDSSGTWTVDTPHRGKLSVAILGTGMLLSFLLHSYFTKRAGK